MRVRCKKSWDNLKYFEEWNSAPFKMGETKVQFFVKESAKLFANTKDSKVQSFGKEKCKTHRQL